MTIFSQTFCVFPHRKACDCL